jgi:CTP synthase
MRLGSYACKLAPGSLAQKIYKKDLIQERHRHRFEFNNKYREILKKYGLTLSGICEERDLVEMIEIKNHPWFVGCQFHPEFKSKPMNPHPLFTSFISACLTQSVSERKDKKQNTQKSNEQMPKGSSKKMAKKLDKKSKIERALRS